MSAVLQQEFDGIRRCTLDEVAVVCSSGEEGTHRGRLWRMLEKDQYLQGMWEYFSFERLKAKKFMKEAEKEKQEGIQGQRQRESFAKEIPGTNKVL